MELMRRVLLTSILSVFLTMATTAFVAAVEVGDRAPDFELESTKGGKLKLSSLRGKNVLINFYGRDFDPT